MSEIPESMIEWTVRAFTIGRNTAEMVRHRPQYNFTEADYERALHIGLARRRADKQADELARAMGRLADEMGPNV